MANSKSIGTAYSDPGELTIENSTFGASSTDTISFFNVTKVAQPADAVQATITATWVTISDGAQGFGFQTSDQIISVIAQLKQIAHVLKTLGLWKGAA